MLWTHEIGHSPFAAAPTIADIDGDGNLEVIAASFQDELAVLSGKDGKILRPSKWPHTFLDISTHSSPLLVRK